MKLRVRSTLIPRNNWDYGLRSLLVALGGVHKPVRRAPHIENMFQKKAIWTTSGRVSLYAILKALDLPPGAQVGVPIFCCPVVFEAVCQAGLSPRFLDSNDDCNISVEDLCKKRADLVAVVAVHMFGNPCDMDAIMAVAGPIPVIEDCAQSIFSTYKGRPTGSLATASFFSFRCGKYLSAGEGSAILCRDLQLRRQVERIVDSFASWSMRSMFADSFLTYAKAMLYHRPWYGVLGYPIGMRLDKKLNLTAKDGFEKARIAPTHLALVDARIAHFEEKVNVQRNHALRLLSALAPGNYTLPSESNGCTSNWYQFALRFENTRDRDRMADYLFARGIDTSKYADNVPDEARSRYAYAGDCPNAEKLSKTILLVPIHYTLHARDIDYIAQSINEGVQIIANRERRLYPMKQARETASVHES